MSEPTDDLVEAREVIELLLEGAGIHQIKYAAGFSIELSRSRKDRNTEIPLVVRLTLRSQWWIGNRPEWEIFLSQTEMSSPVSCGDVEDPLRAYSLMCMNGYEVEAIDLSDDGTLRLLTRAENLTISGQEDTFDESWILDIPEDVPHSRDWSVVCDSEGTVFSRRP
jgi:hypothetical protein